MDTPVVEAATQRCSGEEIETGPMSTATEAVPTHPATRENASHSAERPESDDVPILRIRATSGWRAIDFRELLAYRDLFWFLTWRSVKVRYAQSAVGIGWAVVQPVVQTVVFTVVFGKLANISMDGGDFGLMCFIGMVPWTYFSNALTEGANSLITNTNMLSKVYFPRLVLPLSAVAAKLVDFGIAFGCALVLLAWKGVVPGWGVLLLPYLVLLLMLSAAGLGMWLTALAIQYRDVKHAMTFAVQLLMYVAPVVYPASAVPKEWRLVYAANPLVGVIEGFRAALTAQPMPWAYIGIGTLTAVLTAISGAMYFRSRERLFADVA